MMEGQEAKGIAWRGQSELLYREQGGWMKGIDGSHY
jgi:hypothetical protein